MEPLSGPLPHGLMGLPTSPIPDTSMVAKSRGDHEDKTAQAPATGWSCSRTDRKPSTLAQRPIELCRKRATDNPMGIENTTALDGDGEFLSTRVEYAHYQEQGPRTSTRSEASLTALQRRHNKNVTLNKENQGQGQDSRSCTTSTLPLLNATLAGS